ncbi:MAG TPA: TIGR02678 family protein [Ktedonobacteraceae bacterium]|nr:TIGR02678 family protein [Ktedonobacteraceae bacterium]
MQNDEQQILLYTDIDEELWGNAAGAEEQEPQAAPLPVHTPRQMLQAHTILLDNPIVSLHDDAEAYRLVRTHFPALAKWHEQHTGWRIQRGPSFFRLERHLQMPVSPFLDDRLKRPRDFVCLTWILWFAEQRFLAGGGRNQQFLLSQLTEELQRQSEPGPGTALDFRNLQDRYSMRRALEYLTQLGGLQALEGEVRSWAEDAPDQEVLYEFTPISHSLIEALSEQRVSAMAKRIATQNNHLLTSDLGLPALAQDLPPLVRVWRTLLLGPALLRYDDAAAFAALVAHAEQVSEELAQNFGWLLELNSDYACIVRGGTLSAAAGPTLALNSALDQIILLLCTAFRESVEQGLWSPDAYGCLHISSFDINTLFSDLRLRYGSYWGATVKESKATDLLNDIYARMRLLGLLRGPDLEGHMLILPTAARYSVSYDREPTETEPSATDSPAPAASSARPARTRSRKTEIKNVAPQMTFDWDDADNDGRTKGQ